MGSKYIDKETIEYLDSIASIIAGLQELDKTVPRGSDPDSQCRTSMLIIGEAYMFLYNRLLDDYKCPQ